MTKRLLEPDLRPLGLKTQVFQEVHVDQKFPLDGPELQSFYWRLPLCISQFQGWRLIHLQFTVTNLEKCFERHPDPLAGIFRRLLLCPSRRACTDRIQSFFVHENGVGIFREWKMFHDFSPSKTPSAVSGLCWKYPQFLFNLWDLLRLKSKDYGDVWFASCFGFSKTWQQEDQFH